MNDVRLALRQFRRRPGFTATAVITLALGIAATTALFTVVRSVVLAPLPYEAPEELVVLDSPVPKLAPDAVWGLSEAAYHHFREETSTLEELGAFSTTTASFAGDVEARRVASALVTRSLLTTIRARPAVGRLFTEEEDGPGGPDVVVLGHDFWTRAFGADSAVVGTVIELEAIPYEVVGVMAPGIHLPDHGVDIWTPRQLDPLRDPVNAHWLRVLGRLEPGRDVVAAQDEMNRLTAQLPEVFPSAYYPGFLDNYGFRTRVRPLHHAVVGDMARVLWILFGAVGIVLVIATANVLNLFAVRTEGRRQELAVRTALGAGRGRLARQGIVEGVVLALLAGVLGLVLADSAIRLLLALAPSQLPRLAEVSLGWRSAGFALGAALLVGAMVGMLPILRTRTDLRDALGARSATRAQHVMRRVLVGAQVALAVVLLAAAGLMVRSIGRLAAVEPGFEPANTVTVDLALPFARYRSYEEVTRFYRDLITQVEGLPGVRTAGAGPLPLEDFRGGCTLTFVEDRPVIEDERPPCVSTALAAPGYFDALGIPLRGRAPTWGETEGAVAGVVVTEALARRFWPDEDPIGKGVRGNGWGQPFYRVVGVTAPLRAEGLDQAATEAVFYPIVPLEGAPLWSPPRSMTLIIRTDGAGAEALAGPVRRTVAGLDPSIPVGRITGMPSVVSRSYGQRSFTMLLLGIAAGMALLLSVVGLYGVVAYVVTRRTKEIGIRMALGAQAGEVAAGTVRDALLLAGAGCATGLLGALLVTRTLRAVLFEISPTDPWTLAGATLLLLAVAALASLFPARRAARIDPMEALRHE